VGEVTPRVQHKATHGESQLSQDVVEVVVVVTEDVIEVVDDLRLVLLEEGPVGVEVHPKDVLGDLTSVLGEGLDTGLEAVDVSFDTEDLTVLTDFRETVLDLLVLGETESAKLDGVEPGAVVSDGDVGPADESIAPRAIDPLGNDVDVVDDELGHDYLLGRPRGSNLSWKLPLLFLPQT